MNPKECFRYIVYQLNHKQQIPRIRGTNEMEKIILTNPWITFAYIQAIIKDRWIEAETILFNTEYYNDYKTMYIREERK